MTFGFGIEGADIWNVKHNKDTGFAYESKDNKEDGTRAEGCKDIDSDNLVIISSISKNNNAFKYEVTYGDDIEI